MVLLGCGTEGETVHYRNGGEDADAAGPADADGRALDGTGLPDAPLWDLDGVPELP